MKSATAVLPLLLVACTASQPPTPPIAPSPASAAQERSMAKRAPGQEPSAPLQIFRAFGTEPFWNVNVEGDTMTWTTPEDQVGVVMKGLRRSLDGGVEISGSHAGKAFVLTVTAGDCNDGMSDNRYTLVSAFRYGEIDYKGCGEAAK
ncbi:MAG: hypothetical protein E6Q81_01490 [Thermomonas sp.]|nr:MAG: hypothetical protein E6Q81_01490 [Thermomonas sp.]